MKSQCTRYWRKCSIRTGNDSFSHQLPGLCYSCQVRRPDGHSIASDDAIHLTIRLKPSMAMQRADLESAKGRAINRADIPSPENVKSYITNCIKRYQQAHNLPEDSVKVSDGECAPTAGGPRAAADAYHYHSCGLSKPNCTKLEEYHLQMMLLEHHNKKRLMMARGETDVAGVPPKQPAKPLTPQDVKFLYSNMQDYKFQVRCGELPAKEEQPMPPVPDRHQSAAQSKPEPQDPLNVQAMKNLSLKEYQKQLMAFQCGNHKNRLNFPSVATQPSPWATTQSPLAKQEASLAGREQAWSGVQSKAAQMSAGAQAGATTNPAALHPFDDYQNRFGALQSRSAIQDYNMQLMLLEQQNRKRLMMARTEQDKVTGNSASKAPDGGQSKQQTEGPTLERRERETLAGSGESNAQVSEQILEMGSALEAQKNVHQKGDVSVPVHPDCEDEQDSAMWSTDEFDEWSNCGDDMEAAEGLEV